MRFIINSNVRSLLLGKKNRNTVPLQPSGLCNCKNDKIVRMGKVRSENTVVRNSSEIWQFQIDPMKLKIHLKS